MARIENPQFKDFCRLCATNITNVSAVNIFKIEDTIQQINQCLSIKVHKADMLPKQICENCLIKLDSFCNFRERAAETEKLFVDLYKEFALALPQNNNIDKFIVPMDQNDGLVVVEQHQILNEDSLDLTLLSQGEDMIVKQEITLTCDNVSISPHSLDLNNQDIPSRPIQTPESTIVDSNPDCTDGPFTMNTNLVTQLLDQFRHGDDLINRYMEEVNSENDIRIINDSQCGGDQQRQTHQFELKIESEEIKLEDDLVVSPLSKIPDPKMPTLCREDSNSGEHSLLMGEQLNDVSVPHVYKCAKCAEVFTSLDVSDSHSNKVLGACAKAPPLAERCDENVPVGLTEKHSPENSAEGKVNGGKVKRIKRKNYCIFCKNYILNFARHMARHHLNKKEVQNIFSFSPLSKMRKHLLGQLRRRSNFLDPASQKPVRRQRSNVNVLPCTNCLGYFSSKLLYRHRKVCMGKSDGLHQVKGQNLLLKDLPRDKQLKEKVFLRMRHDDISMTAKSDELICAFGARYFKSNPKKESVNITSRKMRELARLLIEVQKLEPSIKKLFEALRSDHFEILVAATKVVAQYDKQNESFQSASTALNLGTAIRQCCQMAILDKTQTHATLTAEETEADLNKLIQLIDTEWRSKISSKASNDLCKRKDKITMITLATDLKLLQEYLLAEILSSAFLLFTDNTDKDSYITLLETVFCAALLFNRRRDELQRLPLRVYVKSEDPPLEEYSKIIAPLENILYQKYKRVAVCGDKRSRRVLVFFNAALQEQIDILLRHRGNFVNKNNIYLFGHPCKTQPMCGYRIIQKYAKLAGVSNPQALANPKLRKHVSTLTQVSSLSQNGIDQLSSYISLHSYDLNDMTKTANKCKFILQMEKGTAADYKGASLDEVNVNLNEDLQSDDIGENQKPPEDSVPELGLPGTSRDLADAELQLAHEAPNPLLSPGYDIIDRRKRILVPWTDQQKEVVLQFFAKHIEKKKPPKKHECVVLKEQHAELLHNKDWLKIKVFVQNVYVKRQRRW